MQITSINTYLYTVTPPLDTKGHFSASRRQFVFPILLLFFFLRATCGSPTLLCVTMTTRYVRCVHPSIQPCLRQPIMYMRRRRGDDWTSLISDAAPPDISDIHDIIRHLRIFRYLCDVTISTLRFYHHHICGNPCIA